MSARDDDTRGGAAPDAAAVLALFADADELPLKAMLYPLGLDAGDRRTLRTVLDEMAADGLLTNTRGLWYAPGPAAAGRIQKAPVVVPAPAPEPPERERRMLRTAAFRDRLPTAVPAPAVREAVVDGILDELGIARRFPPRVLDEAAAFGDAPAPGEAAHREDLTAMPLVTIDGEDAKDFDDAVFAEPAADGGVRLVVAIADVARYVAVDTPLDLEARRRGTSVYMPGRVEPMLPYALSAGLCSLKPDVPRLALVCDMLCDADGTVRSARAYEALMRSAARLTYTRVQAWFDARDPAGLSPAVRTSLDAMQPLARAMQARRRAAGALSLDIAEPVVVLDTEGHLDSFERRPRFFAHELIEQFMVAANEAVARLLTRDGVPGVYRVHERPDPERLERCLDLVRRFGVRVPAEAYRGRGLDRLIAAIDTLPDDLQRAFLHKSLLRAMKQARYSAENAGHFGLASGAYLHFTSPIRRYPDLLVHRQLKAHLERQRGVRRTLPHSAQELEGLAAQASDNERRAVKAERAVFDLYAVLWIRPRANETFAAVITGVEPFGAFVTLDAAPVDGLVRSESLSPRRLDYDAAVPALVEPGSRRAWRLGDRIIVRVLAAELETRRIEFVPVTTGAERAAAGDGRAPYGRAAPGGRPAFAGRDKHRKGAAGRRR